jgi:phage protein U
MGSKASDWMNLSASIAVILGIVFLGLEISQNTEMMKSQTRDSISEKQMMFSEWVATEIDLAETIAAATAGETLSSGQAVQYGYFLAGVWREWENSYYQFQQGLFDRDEFEPRMNRWHEMMRTKIVRDTWVATRMNYSPAFRVEVDRIVNSYEAGAQL